MEAGHQIQPGYCDYDIAEVVDKDLKNVSSPEELAFLRSNVNSWRTELIQLKKRLENQFTSLRVSNFSSYTKYCTKEITYLEYIQIIDANNIKRVNASRFLRQVEAKLLQIESQR